MIVGLSNEERAEQVHRLAMTINHYMGTNGDGLARKVEQQVFSSSPNKDCYVQLMAKKHILVQNSTKSQQPRGPTPTPQVRPSPSPMVPPIGSYPAIAPSPVPISRQSHAKLNNDAQYFAKIQELQTKYRSAVTKLAKDGQGLKTPNNPTLRKALDIAYHVLKGRDTSRSFSHLARVEKFLEILEKPRALQSDSPIQINQNGYVAPEVTDLTVENVTNTQKASSEVIDLSSDDNDVAPIEVQCQAMRTESGDEKEQSDKFYMKFMCQYRKIADMILQNDASDETSSPWWERNSEEYDEEIGAPIIYENHPKGMKELLIHSRNIGPELPRKYPKLVNHDYSGPGETTYDNEGDELSLGILESSLSQQNFIIKQVNNRMNAVRKETELFPQLDVSFVSFEADMHIRLRCSHNSKGKHQYPKMVLTIPPQYPNSEIEYSLIDISPVFEDTRTKLDLQLLESQECQTIRNLLYCFLLVTTYNES